MTEFNNPANDPTVSRYVKQLLECVHAKRSSNLNQPSCDSESEDSSFGSYARCANAFEFDGDENLWRLLVTETKGRSSKKLAGNAAELQNSTYSVERVPSQVEIDEFRLVLETLKLALSAEDAHFLKLREMGLSITEIKVLMGPGKQINRILRRVEIRAHQIFDDSGMR